MEGGRWLEEWEITLRKNYILELSTVVQKSIREPWSHRGPSQSKWHAHSSPWQFPCWQVVLHSTTRTSNDCSTHLVTGVSMQTSTNMYLHHIFLHSNQWNRNNVLEPHSDRHSSSHQVGSIWLCHIALRTTGHDNYKCCFYCSHHGDSQGHCMHLYIQVRNLWLLEWVGCHIIYIPSSHLNPR